MEEATSTVVTADILHSELQVVRNEFRAEMAEMRADMYRAFWFLRDRHRRRSRCHRRRRQRLRLVSEATSPLVTREMFRADLYRALWFFATGIVAANAVISGAVVALVKLL